ncbi:3-deoxy-D-manno-octulosonate 8-phosphate phosphatase (KDO 8-P phosphatase) [Lutibacter agarilyticus]|uniref:3-deoxy-D-manno-octulosonate 8-phosphate phosphatase (KDO 8-P phosphatase) n=1 Tax=Lutibacter agarilyticus TaxID=1109740 RepID=A0A238VJ81_9FLAO|nr:HAD-IIIA family hydrolase [Lutibacter agarilyticus]SNR34452.1 3-deoxy-D-manno-octulosonate 8-phosphate phosphatase (KDO 8-P phosphatase) [Lutibacter agarilyticus]
MEKSYKEIMPQITTFMFDVDGVLTNGLVHISSTGELTRLMNTKDGYALKSAIDAGYNICIISGGQNEGVRSRLVGLGITDIYLGAHDKIIQFNKYVKEKNLTPEEILYMGDDIPDYPVMKLVGLATCPKDAVAEIQNASHYISHKKGGLGCVRDVIEQVLKVQGKWAGQFHAKYD